MVDVRSSGEYTGERCTCRTTRKRARFAAGTSRARGRPMGPGRCRGRNVPQPQRTRGDLRRRAGFDPDDDVIAYCRNGERSSHTWFVLHQLLGYAKVRNYDGSWTEWGDSVGVPIKRGEQAERPDPQPARWRRSRPTSRPAGPRETATVAGVLRGTSRAPGRYAEHRELLEAVPECQSPLFLAVEVDGGQTVHLFFDAPPESPTTRGFARILRTGLDGLSAAEVLAMPTSSRRAGPGRPRQPAAAPRPVGHAQPGQAPGHPAGRPTRRPGATG